MLRGCAMVAESVLLIWWSPAVLWALVYTSDMMLTLAGARLYKQLEGRFFRFESYELTSFWKATIVRGRPFTPRFVGALILSTAVVAVLGWLSARSDESDPFLLSCLGALFLTQAVVHLRHARNLF